MTCKQDQKIIQLAKDLQSLAKKAVTAYRREVEEILDFSCREKRRIECTLDGMLDFCFDYDMLHLYKKLCRYYFKIDPMATASYVYAYREMWDEEED